MATEEFDNRLKFPPTLIDFDLDVGTTGQSHDTFPAPNQQPRYDWMRLVLIGLLANQSSEDPPTQYRRGTIWYNRSTDAFMVFNGIEWTEISTAILLKKTTTDEGQTLEAWYKDAVERLDRILPRFTFSGTTVGNSIQTIPVPTTIQDGLTGIKSLLRPKVFKNGLLIDPRLCSFSSSCPVFIQLVTESLDDRDKFTVIIERYDLFVEDEVVAS